MIYTVILQKGGSGKTTTAAALAQAAAADGKKVLAVDLDAQGNLSFALGADQTGAGMYEVMTRNALLKSVIQKGIVDIAPAGLALSTLETSEGSARVIQDALEPIKSRYDLIIIDAPAKAGNLQYNALQAADRLIIPIECDSFNLQAFYQTMDAVNAIKAAGNKRLKVAGLIFTKYDGRSNLTKIMRRTIEEKAAAYKVPVLGEVRKAVVIQEAAALQESLFDYAPKSKPAVDYMAIYKKLK